MAALALGGAFFYLVLKNFGFAELAALLSGTGSAAFLVFLFYPFMSLLDVAAWKWCFSGEMAPRVGFFKLSLIRLAGEAVNNITPFIDIGGEPLKIHFVHRFFGVPLSGATAATVVARSSLLVSEAFFMLFGVVLSFELIPLEPRYRAALISAFLLICAAFIAFIVIQQRDWLKKINPEISRYYVMHSERFFTAVPLNTLGWILGGIETYFFCRILHLDISILEAVMLESLLQLIRTGSFFIPGNLGAQEGGMAFLMGQMGHEPVMGVGLSLLKRFRQILWTGAGFLLWVVFQYQESKQKEVALENTQLLSFDTWLDRRIHRPVAEVAAFLLSKTPVTPDQVTLCTLLPAVLSASFFALGGFAPALLGIFFYYVWAVTDHVDGSLARRKRLFSKYGRMLDDSCDNIASTIIFLGIFFGLIRAWNLADRFAITAAFFGALIANTLSQILVTVVKRRTRQSALALRKASQSFLWKQKALDCFTGRDAVYLFLLLVLGAHAWGGRYFHWYTFTMGFYVIGMLVVSLISFREYMRPR